MTPASRRRSATVLLSAAALAIAISFVPYGRTLTYPFRLFVTYVHESSHALTTLLTGGHVEGMRVAPDGSGVAFTRGGSTLLIASAGYVGTALFGAALLLACPRPASARRLLKLLASGTLLATLLLVAFSPLPFLLTTGLAAAIAYLSTATRPGHATWLLVAVFAVLLGAALLAILTSQGALFTWLTGCCLSAALLAAGSLLRPTGAHFLLAFLAVQCCLAAVADLLTLVVVTTQTSTHTDALIMQNLTGVPALLWALLWTAISLAALGLALRSFTRATIGARA